MVYWFHEGGVCLVDWQTGPAAPHVPAENTHQDCEGKETQNKKGLCIQNDGFLFNYQIQSSLCCLKSVLGNDSETGYTDL